MTSNFFEWIARLISAAERAIKAELALTFVIPSFDVIMSVWYHLDPRVYRAAWRIRSVFEGRMPKKSEDYILLVLFARHSLPGFTRTLLEAIGRSDINLIVISNGGLSPTLREELAERAILTIDRANLGRDIGAYKDGIAIARERFPEMQRLILMNDSVFYFKKGLDEMLRALCGKADLIGVNETFENHYHIQSFILSFSQQLMNHKKFQRFWHRYRPISTRRWSIHKGEVAFTRRMMRAGIRPHILYHGPALSEHLRTKSPRELRDAARFLPTHFRKLLYDKFDVLIRNQMGASRENISLMGRGMRSAEKADSEIGSLHTGDFQQMVSVVKDSVNMTVEYSRWKVENFVDQIVSTVSTGNQSHTGGFLFVKYLGAPFVKRDLFNREVYELAEIYDILTDLREPLKEEMMADLRQRGTRAELHGLAHILHYYGAI